MKGRQGKEEAERMETEDEWRQREEREGRREGIMGNKNKRTEQMKLNYNPEF